MKFVSVLNDFDLDYTDFLKKQDTHHRAKHTYLAQELVILNEMQGKLGELQAWLQSHASTMSQKMSNMYE